ncbi:hypothetical protein J7643_03915 [bacterium]|nr:hypothetical protein [bacterium]
MLDVKVKSDTIWVGEHFSVDFQRTLRIPDDGIVYPLPPGLSRFPVRRVDDYLDRVPPAWREHGGVFIPMYQREALWLCFGGSYWKPHAVKIAIGKINVVTGRGWAQPLEESPQDYLVCPDQPWLDGINAGEGMIRQFVAMPLGQGYTVEGQLTGAEKHGGIQLIAFAPKPGRFPDEPPRVETCDYLVCESAAAPSMGLAAGGKMTQKIYADEYGLDTWDQENYGRVFIHIVDSMVFREITGEEPPPTPVTAKTYAQYHLPWFSLYDELKQDLPPSGILKGVKSVKQVDVEKGHQPQQDDSSVPVDNIVKLGKKPNTVRDGEW